MKSTTDKRILLGVILITAGTILLLRYLDIIPFFFPDFLISWKSILIVLGIILLITERNKSTGFILLSIGSIFMAMDVFDKSFWEVFRFAVPIALIIAGISLLLKTQSYTSRDINIPVDDNADDYISDVSIFGGGEKRITSQQFKGGKITAIFGGSEINLRSAKLAPGINAIELSCIFGGVTIFVPEGWHVKNDVSAIFGGFSDKRMVLGRKLADEQPDAILYIKGTVIFGGGELK